MTDRFRIARRTIDRRPMLLALFCAAALGLAERGPNAVAQEGLDDHAWIQAWALEGRTDPHPDPWIGGGGTWIEVPWDDPYLDDDHLNDDGFGTDEPWDVGPGPDAPWGGPLPGDEQPAGGRLACVPGEFVLAPGGRGWSDEEAVALNVLAEQFGWEFAPLGPDLVIALQPWEGGFGEPGEQFPGAGGFEHRRWFGGEDGHEILELLHTLGLIEPDFLVGLPETTQKNALVVASDFGRTFPTQPSFRRVRARRAHRVADGDGVVVAVVDTGVDGTHPLLRSRVLPGIDLVDGDDDASEERIKGAPRQANASFGHGTLVAGIVAGVAPGARILPVRVFDSGGRGTSARVAVGIRAAVSAGADVVNLSLGLPPGERSRVIDDAVADAIAAGVTVVVAAGNDRSRRVNSPADIPGTISVTALGRRSRVAGFANGTRGTSVMAPGRMIVGPHPGGTWARGKGTSFAAPFVSAAAAVLRSHRPDLPSDAVRRRLTQRVRLRVDRVVK